MQLKKFPCPKKLKGIPENVLSIDLGKHVGFAYVKGEELYCGHYIVDVKQLRFNQIQQISDEYKKLIDTLLSENQDMNLVLLEDNQYYFKQRYLNGKSMAYYKKLQIMVEGLFCSHWQGEVKRYFDGTLKKKYFGTARKEIVKNRV